MKKYLVIFMALITVLSGCSRSKQIDLQQTNIHQTTIPSKVDNSGKSRVDSHVLTINNIKYDLNLELSISSDNKLTKEELGLLRNGIYAKYGYKFKSKEYSDYFSQIDWYKPSKDSVDELLNEIDKKNINLILALEKGFNLSSNGQYKFIENGQSHTLTGEEINNFENVLSDKSNCGFLTCEYSEPSKIDPNEVFYDGSGLSKDISETEKRDLIKNYGFSEDDFKLDYIKLKTIDVNNLLSKKIGLTLKDIGTKLTYKYVSKYDAYYCFHGDTNYIDLKCIDGNVDSDEVYTIKYISYVHSSMPINRKVTFKIVDDNIIFLSNTKVN
ncbi:MAG: YARHG domain-containing protein [Bacillota bacterium]|nr:YARHG domain-containing protein [Bacillota bacterium]